jgi:hypothetical protein
MKWIPYEDDGRKAVAVKHFSNWGGLAIYEFVGADKGELEAVRFRFEDGDDMTKMRKSKIRWAIPKRRAEDGDKPVEPVPYFVSDSERYYLDEFEMCSPGWGAAWSVEYVDPDKKRRRA